MAFLHMLSLFLSILSGAFILFWICTPLSMTEKVAVARGTAKIRYNRLFIAVAIFVVSLSWLLTM